MKTFKIQHIIMTLVLLLGAMPAALADNRLYVRTANIKPGTTGQLSFSLENSQEFFGFQLDIELPAGLELVATDGKAVIRMSERADGGVYSVVSNLLSPHSMKLGAFSTTHTAFSSNDGVLFRTKVRASDDFAGGTVSVNNVRFIDGNDMDGRLPDAAEIFSAYHGPVTEIQLDRYSVELLPGQTISVSATVSPDYAYDRSVTWSSDNPTVATVDAEGRITAVGVGTANVMVRANDGSGVSASCQVTVNPILAESLTLSVTEWSGKVGETMTLNATVSPDNTSDKTVTWSSSDVSVATVDANGKVTAVSLGNTTITATSGSVSATCAVTVVPTPVESLTLSASIWGGTVGESIALIATVLPENATDKAVTWRSSDKRVATVDANGNVTAVSLGTAVITATCGSVSETCAVTVVATPVESLTLSATTWSGKVG